MERRQDVDRLDDRPPGSVKALLDAGAAAPGIDLPSGYPKLVEPICAVLPIAPATYFRHKLEQHDPMRRSARAQVDEVLARTIRRVWHEHHEVSGARKVWRQLGREGMRVARGRVRRVMRAIGLVGAVRGRAWTITTESARVTDRPGDLVDRDFTATRPNQLWVSDFTYVGDLASSMWRL